MTNWAVRANRVRGGSAGRALRAARWANCPRGAAQCVFRRGEGASRAVSASAIGGGATRGDQVLAGHARGLAHARRGRRTVVVPGACGASDGRIRSALARGTGGARRATCGRAAGGRRRLVSPRGARGWSGALQQIGGQGHAAARAGSASAVELGTRCAGDVRAWGAIRPRLAAGLVLQRGERAGRAARAHLIRGRSARLLDVRAGVADAEGRAGLGVDACSERASWASNAHCVAGGGGHRRNEAARQAILDRLALCGWVQVIIDGTGRTGERGRVSAGAVEADLARGAAGPARAGFTSSVEGTA